MAKDALFISLISAAMFFLGRYSAQKTAEPVQPPRAASVAEIPKLPEAFQNDAARAEESGGQDKQDLLKDNSEKPAQKSSATPAETKDTNHHFIASKNGKTYYPNTCGSYSRIKPENRVYFATESDARAKGLTKSKSCK